MSQRTTHRLCLPFSSRWRSAHRRPATGMAWWPQRRNGSARCWSPPVESRLELGGRGRPPRPARPPSHACECCGRSLSIEGREGERRWPGAPVWPLPAALDPLFQVGPLPTDGGGLAVTREHLGVTREGEELAADAVDDGRKARVRVFRISRSAWKEGVAGKQALSPDEADAAGSVPRRVNRHELVLAKAETLAVLDAMIGLDRHHRFVRLVTGELRVGLLADRFQGLDMV